MFMKKLISMLLCVVMICPAVFMTANAADTPSSWAAAEVNEATALGLVPDTLKSGYMKNTTREEFCDTLVLLVAMKKPSLINAEYDNMFSDTQNKNVNILGSLKIVTGTGGGLFNPSGSITRQEAATMLTRAARSLGGVYIDTATDYGDKHLIADWAADGVAYVSGAGIMRGTGDGFDPQGVYTREQTIATVLRLHNFLQSADVPLSIEYIENRLAEYDHRRYVYSDFCAGKNTYTQKVWMGNSSFNAPDMEEYAKGYEGISGIKATINLRTHSWGGYMFVNGVLKAGSGHPEADYGRVNGGFDMTGADRLVFMARGETGKEVVEFYTGGLGWSFTSKIEPFADSTPKISLGTVTLGKDWQRYEIPLGNADLSRINCGFAWVANDTNNPGLDNITFYVDDIYFNFPEKQSPPVFLESFAAAPVGTDDSVINNFAYTYDNAMAIMALCYAGKTDRAKQIADALVYAVDNDRDYSDGRIRNAYSSGDIRSFSNWYSAKGTQFARMPGFYQTKDMIWYEDVGTLSTSAGNAAWAVLGLMEAYHSIGDASYLRAAQAVGDFLLTLKSNTGGFTGGYEGWENTKITYKSTEHNIDLISAFAILANCSSGAKKQEYASASEHAKAFVMSMYDADKACFYTGTALDGVTVNKSVLPLDTNTWAMLAMPDFEDIDKVMSFVEENMRVGEGYDFNDDKDGVWFEGTAQVALVYKMTGDAEKYDRILGFMRKNTSADGSITAADRNNVTTGFDWEYGKRTHLGATAWLAFAETGRNPFEVY